MTNGSNNSGDNTQLGLLETAHDSLQNRTQKDNANSDQFFADAGQIWLDVQTQLRKRLGDRIHKSWTGQLELHAFDDSAVVLAVPSSFVASRIEGKYGDLVKTLWAQHDPRVLKIEASNPVVMKTGARLTAPTLLQKAPLQKHQNAPYSAPAANIIERPAPRAQAAATKSKAVKRFRFDNFVVGASNQLAFAVAKSVAGAGETQYNPVVIHGPNGMGKTHLLHAVKTEALEQNPGLTVRLISAEDFVARFVSSVRAQGRSEIDAFKSDLRNVDLLIIDDAHFIADKPGSQEELLHTMIALVDNGTQILLASDRHPHAIVKASERLKSHLCGGLLCDIGPCDYDLRLRILDRLIARKQESGLPSLAMPQNARDHLAARINATPRDLEGAFHQILARMEFLGTDLTLESVQEALAHSRFSGGAKPTVDKIQRAVCKHFGLSMEELLSKRRARAIARPRQVAMFLSKALTTRSLPDIGRRFGGRDHTTVIHAVKRIEALRKEDNSLNTHVENLTEALTAPV